MPTIKDVAALSGVSTATVSNYLNHTKPVSKDVSEKIQFAIDKLHYKQNFNARNLKIKENRNIGIILPNLNDSYYVQLFQGIKSYLQNADYYVDVSFTNDIPEFEMTAINNFLKKQINGLILVSCQPNKWKFYYENFKNIPIVLIDRNIHGLDANFITFNNEDILKDMVNTLLDAEINEIYLMSGPDKFDCEASCVKGFNDALHAHNLTPKPYYFVKTNMSKEDAFSKTIDLLKEHLPNVIISSSETIAIGIIEALTVLGYTVNDIPVLTLGEEHWNIHTHSFALSSYVRPAIKLGKTSARLLIEQMHSPLTKDMEKITLNGSKSSLNPQITSFVKTSSDRKNNNDFETSRKIKALLLDTPQVHSLLGLLRNFEKRTHVKVEASIIPHHYLYDTIFEKYNDPDDFPYDVFMYDIPWLPSLASEGILEDITDKMPLLNPEIFLPNCLKYYSTFNGRNYGIPFMYAPQVFYYRKDLFDDQHLKAEYKKINNISLRPPKTLKEFTTISDFFTNKTDIINYGTSIPTAYSECLTPEIYMRLRSFGGSLFDSSGNVCLDSDQALRAYINFIRSIKLAKPDYRIATDTSVVQDFLNGETAMLITYPSFLKDVTDLRKNSIMGSIGYSMIPGRSPLLGGWGLGISTNSEMKQEAFEFIKWTCDEAIGNYSTLLGGHSAIASTYKNDELTELYPWLPLYGSIYESTKPTIPPKLSNGKVIPQYRIDNIVCKWIYKLLETDISVQDTISNTHKELEELVNEYLKQNKN